MNITRKWSGYWINTGNQMGTPSHESVASPYLRKTFFCDEKPEKAIAYLCGLGWHVLYINGEKADDRVLAPVVTQFDKRASYIAYDITKFLEKGKNAITVQLGNGWYNCQTAEVWSFDKAPWRDFPKLLCDVEADGKIIAKSDCTWKTHNSPVIFDALRNGEFYDATLEIDGFADPSFDDSGWQDAVQCNPPGGMITLEDMEPCKVTKTYQAIAVYKVAENQFVYDFGTNLTGWCRIAVKGEKGASVKIQYSEQIRSITHDIERGEIDSFVKSGEFQTDNYVLKGSDREDWEPRFTYHGFRYAKITVCGNAELKKIEACFVHSAFKQIGAFESSDETLNTLQRNTVQSYLSNFTGIPTDCPHREKNGWTGDAQLAMETGLWNFKAEKACTHFLEIFADAQRPNGQLPGIAPTGGWGFNWGSGPAWDILLFEYPWQMYLFCGNTENIRRFYGNMQSYIEYCQGMSENDLVRFGLGDWCHHTESAMVTAELTSTACYYYAVTRMIEFAGVLSEKSDVKKYSDLAKKIRAAFNEKFYNNDGTYASGEWTALAAALYFGLAEEENREKIARNLVKMVRANDHKVDFGILGAKYVPRVLADFGYADDAFKLITQPEYPGWGYWVRQGATSLWERWNGTASQNHIMYGDISAWMYQYLAGVTPQKEAPGFKKFLIKPEFVEGLSSVRMSHESPYGLIRSEWKRCENKIICEFEIPAETTADIILPGETLKNATGIQKITL